MRLVRDLVSLFFVRSLSLGLNNDPVSLITLLVESMSFTGLPARQAPDYIDDRKYNACPEKEKFKASADRGI